MAGRNLDSLLVATSRFLSLHRRVCTGMEAPGHHHVLLLGLARGLRGRTSSDVTAKAPAGGELSFGEFATWFGLPVMLVAVTGSADVTRT